MRATTLALLLAFCALAGTSAGAPARLDVKHRLALDSADARRSAPMRALPAPVTADEALAAWSASFLPPPPVTLPWWHRLWPWPSMDGEQVTVRVRPTLPFSSSGALAAPAELHMPRSQLAKEQQFGLQVVSEGDGSSSEDDRSPSGSSGKNSSIAWPWPWPWPPKPKPKSGDMYSYNSSAVTPLVPLWLSWMTDPAEVRNRTRGLDFSIAKRLSAYTAIAYCNMTNIGPWNCSRCDGEAAGFETQQVVYDPAWNLLGYVGYARPLDAIVIVFRGTDSHSLYNWVENMRTWRTDYQMAYPDAPPYAYVHGGFYYSYNSSALAPNISAAVKELRIAHPSSPVFVAGHSLGGALATICAMDVKLNLRVPDVRVFTYGSPRVGNAIFAKWFESIVQAHYRFTHNRDIVPSVPPTYMGFHHVSREIWLLDILAGRPLVGVCDGSGEDPLCHAAMCHVGLCSSLADHLLYLSEMYAPRPQGC